MLNLYALIIFLLARRSFSWREKDSFDVFSFKNIQDDLLTIPFNKMLFIVLSLNFPYHSVLGKFWRLRFVTYKPKRMEHDLTKSVSFCDDKRIFF